MLRVKGKYCYLKAYKPSKEGGSAWRFYRFFVLLKNRWFSILPKHLDVFLHLLGELSLEVEMVLLNFSIKYVEWEEFGISRRPVWSTWEDRWERSGNQASTLCLQTIYFWMSRRHIRPTHPKLISSVPSCCNPVLLHAPYSSEWHYHLLTCTS